MSATVRVTVEDGCQMTHTFKGEPFAGFAVTYRPITPAAWQAHLTDQRPWLDRTAKLIAPQIVAWNAGAIDGSVLPITEETVRRLAFPVLDQLLNLIVGYAAPDGKMWSDAKN